MSVWIHHIETEVPQERYNQSDIGKRMLEWTVDERDKRLVRMLYRSSGIETRHSVIPDLGENFFIPTEDGRFRQPSTAERNTTYTREGEKLAVDLGRKLLSSASGFVAEDITHVVTASCTGFFNPGIDYFLCRELDLGSSTQRYHLGFMGCYAAFPALSMATQFCQANPDAVVLIMCLELCSLHLQINGSEDAILANSLFADGAGAALVSARPPQPGTDTYRIDDFDSALIASGKEAMAWSIGNLGFDISLSSYVPKIIGSGIEELLQPLLARNELTSEDVAHWAVHPGGKSIVDKIAKSLELSGEQVLPSRNVLKNFGNMSSATILFVLKEMLTQPAVEGLEKVCAMAFGPGLTVEMGLLQIDRAGDG
ncbi:MAG TPA: type III polyketide synthase [Geopsychrobacteraceae bacterium]|nr:type III polyketide synthase [Geopsychrobacteraceae bacterium]